MNIPSNEVDIADGEIINIMDPSYSTLSQGSPLPAGGRNVAGTGFRRRAS